MYITLTGYLNSAKKFRINLSLYSPSSKEYKIPLTCATYPMSSGEMHPASRLHSGKSSSFNRQSSGVYFPVYNNQQYELIQRISLESFPYVLWTIEKHKSHNTHAITRIHSFQKSKFQITMQELKHCIDTAVEQNK